MEADFEWLKWAAGVVAQHGPWAVLAWYLVRKMHLNHAREADRVEDITKAYSAAIVENTRVTERLAVLIEERTRARQQDG